MASFLRVSKNDSVADGEISIVGLETVDAAVGGAVDFRRPSVVVVDIRNEWFAPSSPKAGRE